MVLDTCQYLEFRESTCTFRISQGFPWCQDGRYIADTWNLAFRVGLMNLKRFLVLQNSGSVGEVLQIYSR